MFLCGLNVFVLVISHCHLQEVDPGGGGLVQSVKCRGRRTPSCTASCWRTASLPCVQWPSSPPGPLSWTQNLFKFHFLTPTVNAVSSGGRKDCELHKSWMISHNLLFWANSKRKKKSPEKNFRQLFSVFIKQKTAFFIIIFGQYFPFCFVAIKINHFTGV